MMSAKHARALAVAVGARLLEYGATGSVEDDSDANAVDIANTSYWSSSERRFSTEDSSSLNALGTSAPIRRPPNQHGAFVPLLFPLLCHACALQSSAGGQEGTLLLTQEHASVKVELFPRQTHASVVAVLRAGALLYTPASNTLTYIGADSIARGTVDRDVARASEFYLVPRENGTVEIGRESKMQD